MCSFRINHPLVIIQSTSSVQYLGENLTAARINCYFDANPPLFNVRWSKGGRTLSATKHRFMHFSSISTENGRLFHAWFEFRQVHPKDAGQYSCQAYNSAGASDIFEIYAVIAKPPRFTRIPPGNVVKRQGDALEVTCDGDSPEQKHTNAAHKKSTVIDGSTDIVFHDKSLKIRSISYKDHGCYDCLVENEVASLTSEMCLIVNDTPPQPPVNATVQSSCCDSTVSWNPGHNGGYRQWFILNIKVIIVFPLNNRYREKSSSSTLWHVANMTANSSSTRFTATNLIPGTTYEYVIQPYNAMGQGYVVHLISKTKSKNERGSDTRLAAFLENPVFYQS
uniref:Uncharacterized protein n=1 Tax=Romanomermis culicivorax TaxID=13658 RepID=A0A915I9L6_ROMCU